MTTPALSQQQTKPSNHTVSIIVPTKNVETLVGPLHKSIRKHLLTECRAWEIIFIDRGSSDGTWSEVKGQIKRGSRYVKAYRLPHDRGQAHAISLGHIKAEGDVVITIDPTSTDSLSDMAHLVRTLAQEFTLAADTQTQKVSSVFTAAGLSLLLSSTKKFLQSELSFSESINEEAHLPVFHGVSFPQSSRA